MPTDKFKFVANDILTSDTSCLQFPDMIESLSILVGNHTREEEAEFKTAFKTADFIEIDGKMVWNRSEENLPEDPEGEWDPKTKTKFLEVKKNFENLSISFSSFNNIEETIKNPLNGLNRNIARAAMSIVSEHYRFANKKYSFVFSYPPDPIKIKPAFLKLKRTGSVFSYELYSTSKRLSDGVNFFDWDSTQLNKIKDPSEDTNGQIICEITVIAKLDLTNFPKERSLATLEIIISSDLPQFRYYGPRVTPEVIQLQNIDPITTSTPVPNFRSPAEQLTEEALINAFQRTNIQIGIIIEKIINSKDATIQLSAIVNLFNQIMIRNLCLKDKIENLLNETKTEVAFALGIDWSDLITRTLAKQAIHNEFVSIFNQLDNIQITSLLENLHQKFIYEVRESAQCLLNENTFLSFTKETTAITDTKSCKSYLEIVLKAIDTIRSSLESIASQRKIEIPKLTEAVKHIYNLKDVSQIFKQYLLSALQNDLENNPFQRQLITANSFYRWLSGIKISKEREESIIIFDFQKTTMQMGIIIEDITSFISTSDSEGLLLSTSYLFQHLIKNIFQKNELLKALHSKAIDRFDLSEEMVESELISIFYQLSNTQFASLLRMQPFLLDIKAIISKLPPQKQTSNSESAYLIPFISKGIHLIHSALEMVKRQKQIIMIGFDKKKSTINNGFFANYLTAIQESLFLTETEIKTVSKLTSKDIEKNVKSEISNISSSSFTGAPADEEKNVEIIVLHQEWSNTKKVKKIQCCREPEKFAKAHEQNPYFEGLNDGASVQAIVSQFLRLYPKTQIIVEPYEPIIGMTVGTIGALVGRYTILHPKKTPIPVLIWKSATNAFMVVLFGIGIGIEFYYVTHSKSDNNEVSNEIFWSRITPGPFTLGILYTIWNAFSPGFKERYFPRNTCLKYVKTALELTSRTLYYGGIFNLALLHVLDVVHLNNPRQFKYQFLSLIPGITLAGFHQTSYKERINLFMVILNASIFTSFLIEDLILQTQTKDENDAEKTTAALIYLQFSFWLTCFFLGSGFVFKNLARFIEQYEGDPQLIIQPALPYTSVDDDQKKRFSGAYKSLQDLSSLQQDTSNTTSERTPLITAAYKKLQLEQSPSDQKTGPRTSKRRPKSTSSDSEDKK